MAQRLVESGHTVALIDYNSNYCVRKPSFVSDSIHITCPRNRQSHVSKRPLWCRIRRIVSSSDVDGSNSSANGCDAKISARCASK